MILMDIKMPELNGRDATRILRKNNVEIPIIAQTAFAMSEDEKKCVEAGCNEYITKPINPEELLKKMSIFFNGTQD
jgi:CheY-like chemotaxis protein